MNYGEIKFYDIADGPGVRVSLFVSGCRHHCKGCFQPQTWAFDYGQLFTADTLQEILDGLKPDYIQGLTLLGGEPFEPENQAVLVRVLKKVRETYPHKDIWCYTGYTYDRDLMPGGCVYTEYTDAMLDCIDMIVDGEFVEELKDITLLFRGSSNQRLIPLHGYEMPR
ncbi:MAG: anaerobic ribonucleoside-triphosphate reductase activating protein [Lachnospiraceae bacterium]|nr:anaerobic ribonucleoside-triphosphate reductase activating protein [Lachnospiraceae bacterium]